MTTTPSQAPIPVVVTPSPPSSEPLGLPDGSVRAIIAIGMVAASLAVYCFTTKLSFDQLLVLIQAPIALYFGQYIRSPGSPNV